MQNAIKLMLSAFLLCWQNNIFWLPTCFTIKRTRFPLSWQTFRIVILCGAFTSDPVINLASC